jgi:hypothetical protein
MADVQGSEKRRQSTDEGNDTDNLAEQCSPTKRTKKGNPEPKTPSPVKGKKGKTQKGKRSDLPSRSNVRSPSEGKMSALLEKKSFSALTQEEITSMWTSNHLVANGNIKFGSSKDLLGEIKLPVSFIQQLDTLYGVNVDAVVLSSLTR